MMELTKDENANSAEDNLEHIATDLANPRKSCGKDR